MPSSRRTPPPRISGTWLTSSSSSRPARISCWIVSPPPPTETSSVAGRLAGQLDGALGPLGDELEGGRAEGQRLALVVGEDEDRDAERWLVAPPAVPQRLGPGPAHGAEHVAPHDHGAGAAESLFHDRRRGVDLAALPAVRLAPGGELDDPLVQRLAAFAERVLLALVGAGEVAVGGDRDLAFDLAHQPNGSAGAPLLPLRTQRRHLTRKPSALSCLRTNYRKWTWL